MPMHRRDAERSLNLLWEFMSIVENSESTKVYSQAISSLHLFLTDVLPASQPCLRARVGVRADNVSYYVSSLQHSFPEHTFDIRRFIHSIFNRSIYLLNIFTNNISRCRFIIIISRSCIVLTLQGDIVEIRPRQDTPVRLVDLSVSAGERLGLVLDSINIEAVNGVSPIVVSLVNAGGVAAQDGRLRRGDQLLEINGHSLKLASLERAR